MTITDRYRWGRNHTPKQIRATTEVLVQHRPLDAERLLAARNLLLRGGWRLERDGVVHFAGGVAVSEYCSCQEGTFILCLHQIAVQILAALPTRRRLILSRGTCYARRQHAMKTT